MRTVAGGAVVAVVGLVAAAGVAQPPVAPAPTPVAKKGVPAPLPADAAIEGMIKNLGSPDYHAREKAGRDLEAVGERAYAYLRRALAEADSPEQSRRLAALIRRVEYERLVNPKRVTMAAKQRTADEAFAEVTKQTGYRINVTRNGPGGDPPKAEVGFDAVPFWQAMDRLAETYGAFVNVNNGDGDEMVHVNLSGQAARHPVVAYVGPFKVAATSVQLSRNVSLTGTDPRGLGFNRPTESIGLMFNLFSEPKTPLMGMSNQVVVAAEDDLGGSMVPPRADPNGMPYGGRVSYYGGGGGYRQYQLNGNLNLSRTGREARAIKFVRAKATVNILAGVVPEVSFADPLKAKNWKATGRTYEVDLESVAPNNGFGNNGYSVALTVRRVTPLDPNNPDLYNWQYQMSQRVELVDGDGNKYRNFGAQQMNQNAGSVSMTLMFVPVNRQGQNQKLGAPVRLALTEWVQTSHEVTFEFKDVPLP